MVRRFYWHIIREGHTVCVWRCHVIEAVFVSFTPIVVAFSAITFSYDFVRIGQVYRFFLHSNNYFMLICTYYKFTPSFTSCFRTPKFIFRSSFRLVAFHRKVAIMCSMFACSMGPAALSNVSVIFSYFITLFSVKMILSWSTGTGVGLVRLLLRPICVSLRRLIIFSYVESLGCDKFATTCACCKSVESSDWEDSPKEGTYCRIASMWDSHVLNWLLIPALLLCAKELVWWYPFYFILVLESF